MSKMLVTGATGFLGRHVLGALKGGPLRPVVLVRSRSAWHTQSWLNEIGEVDVIEGDPSAPAVWEKRAELDGVEVVLHLAAIVRHTRRDPGEMYAVNVEGTANMVRFAASRGARIVFVSSSGTVGCFRHADTEADEHAPYARNVVTRWPYYDSKIRAEEEARRLADKLGVTLSIVRPPVLLGPGDHRFRSTGHVARALDGKVPFLADGGMHFTDVRDVASAIARLVSLTSPRPVYHLPGTASSLAQFFRMVSDVSGAPMPRMHLPKWVALGIANGGAGVSLVSGKPAPKWLPDPVIVEMSSHYWGLSSLWSEEELGYRPRPPLQTLADTVHWLRSARPGSRAH